MSFDPDSITGLVEHWNPDSITGDQDDAISTWTGSVNGIEFTAPSGAEPRLMPGATQPSGRNMLLMNSTGRRMVANHATLNNGQTTIFIVHSPLEIGPANATQWVLNKVNTLVQTIGCRMVSAGDFAYGVVLRLDGSESTARVVEATDYYQHATPQVLTIRYDGTNLILRANGVQVASLSQSGAIDTDNPGDLVLGNHPSSFSNPTAMFGDVLVYDNAVSNTDMEAVEQWLMGLHAIEDYHKPWVVGTPEGRVTFGSGEDALTGLNIRELDANTWIMFGCVRSPSDGWRWVDYWTAPKSDPHTWTRNSGSPIVDADTDSVSTCRGVSAVKDGSTWHLLVDSTGSFYHFTGTDLHDLTDNGEVFVGQGSGWETFVRHPYIAETKVDGKWPVYYDGRDNSATSGVGEIGVAFTSDFDTFTDRQKVLALSDMWWEQTDVSAPVVWKDGDTWVMVYVGFSEGNLRTSNICHWLGLAKSVDGLNWTRLPDKVPILAPIRGDVARQSLNTPEMLFDGDDVHIYYRSLPHGGFVSIEVSEAFKSFFADPDPGEPTAKRAAIARRTRIIGSGVY